MLLFCASLSACSMHFFASKSDHVYRSSFHLAFLQSKVDLIRGDAEFDEDGSVLVNGARYRGKHTLIAVGGYPTVPTNIPGVFITSQPIWSKCQRVRLGRRLQCNC